MRPKNNYHVLPLKTKTTIKRKRRGIPHGREASDVDAFARPTSPKSRIKMGVVWLIGSVLLEGIRLLRMVVNDIDC
jgi:hypothetical protein